MALVSRVNSPLRSRLATERYRRQHDELSALSASMEQKLEGVQAGESATDLRRLLAQYSGKLSVHLRMEDEALYPRALGGGDASLQRVAAALQRDVGPLHEEFQRFVEAWPSAATIESRPRDFAMQLARTLRTIARRMQREEVELYPLVDALE